MARTNNEVSVNKGVLDSAANMVKLGIRWMTDKDSLSAGDTEAIRILTNVYDILSNPVKENHVFHQEADKNDIVKFLDKNDAVFISELFEEVIKENFFFR